MSVSKCPDFLWHFRWVARSPDEVKPVFKTKNAAKAMSLGVVGSDGQRMPLYW